MNQRGLYDANLFTGSANYSYPIAVPKGTNDLTPDVSLSYSSLGSRDFMRAGAGWQMSHDYVERDVNFTPTNEGDDTFKLHFKGSVYDLVYVSSDNRYHTKIESHLHITKLPTSGTNDKGEYWQVVTPDGTIYRFGYGSNSEFVANGRPYVTYWSLDLVTDTHDNKIYYTYTGGGYGTDFLSNITYNNDQSRSIDFTYETSPYQREMYLQGGSVLEYSRLKTITVKTNSTTIRSYDLAYTQMDSGQSLLSSITEKGSDGTALPSTTFTYNPQVKNWPTSPEYFIYNANIDVDLSKTNVVQADVNGDGLSDIVTSKSSGNNTNWDVYLNKGDHWDTTASHWATNLSEANNLASPEMRVVDVTGDGLPDIVRIWGYNWLVWRNTGTSWNTTPEYWLTSSHSIGVDIPNYEAYLYQLADVTGDGLADIVYAPDNSHWYVWKNVGNTWSTTKETWATGLDAKLGDTDTRLMDVNGDGLPDVLRVTYSGSNATWRVWKNNGSAWLTTPEYWINNAPVDAHLEMGNLTVQDVSGDGLPDIVKTNANPNQWLVLTNKGNSWSTTWEEYHNPDGPIAATLGQMADVTGDGLPDIIRTVNNGGIVTWQVWRKPDVAPYLLSQITTAQGGTISYEYTNSTQFDNTGSDALSDLPFNTWVVSKMTTSNGLTNEQGTTDVTTYTYKNGSYDWQDKEFRGFGEVDTVEPNGAKKTYLFNQDAGRAGTMQSVTTTDSDGNPYAKTEQTWSNTQTNGVYTVNLTSEKNYTYDGTADNPKVTQTDYQYDSYGNITKQSDLGDTSVTGDERYTYNEYTVATNASSTQPTHFYSFEGNSTDGKGTNNGTDTNITYATANGKYNQGAGFNGSSSQIGIGTPSSATPFTIVGWIKPSAYPSVYGRILANESPNSLQFSLLNNGHLRLSKSFTADLGTSNTAVGTGSWTHVAVTYDGTTVTFYRDGVADGSASSTQSFANNPMYLGSGNGAYYFNGAMDNVAMYDKALSANEIATVYQETTPGSTPATWITNTVKHTYTNASDDTTKVSESLLYYDGHTALTDAPTKGEVTKKVDWLSGGTNPTTTYAYDTYGNVTSVTDPNTNATQTAYDTTGTYPISQTNAKNQTTTVNYDLGTGNLVSTTDPNTNTTSYEYDVFGRITKEIKQGDTSALPTTAYTYFTDGTAPEGVLVSKREASGQAGTLAIYTWADGLGRTIQTRTDAEDPTKQIVTDTYYDPTGQVKKQTVPELSDLSTTYLTPGYSAGSMTNDASLVSYYQFEGNSNDSKGINNGTDTNITYSSANGKINQGAGFDGTSSKINIGTGAVNPSTNFTYETWIKINALPSVYGQITGTGPNGAELFVTSAGKLALAKAYVTTLGTSNTAISTGVWHHVAVTYDGTTATFYLDGVADGTATNAQTFSDVTRYLGSDDAGYYVNAAMDTFTIFSRPLTGSEVQQLYQETTQQQTSTAKYTSYSYDTLGRPTIIKNPKGDSKTIAYDHGKETVIDENGNIKRFYKNVFGKIATVEEVNGITTYTTTYDYDTRNLLTKITDDKNNEFLFSYDSLGRKTSQTDPDMGTWTYGYDAVGNLTSQTDNNNVTITKTYDELNRLTKTDYPTDTDITYTYDGATIGTLTSITDQTGTVNYTYDNRLRKTQESRTIDTTTKATSYTYDALDRMTTETKPDGEIVTYTHNNQGEIESVSGASSLLTNVDYNALGKITSKTFGNGLTTDYTYNPDDFRLNNIKTGTVQDLSYTYDAVGNVSTRTNNLTAKTETFTYDSLDRLKTASESAGYNYQYDYDSIGNLTKFVDNGVGTDYTYGEGTAGPHAVTSTASGSATITTPTATPTPTGTATPTPTPVTNDPTLKAYYQFEGNSNDSKGTNNGTDTNITYSTANGKENQGAGFDGTTSKINVGTGAVNPSSTLTYAVWIKLNAIPSVYSKMTGTGPYGSEFFVNSAGTLSMSKAYVTTLGSSNTQISTGVWHHVAVTYDGTTATYYLDGQADGSVTSSQTFNDVTRYIGSDNTGYHFNGAMDNFAIYNRALTASDINSLYQNSQPQATPTPTPTGTVTPTPTPTATASALATYTYDANGNMTSDGEKCYHYNEANHMDKVLQCSNNQTIAEYVYDYKGDRMIKRNFVDGILNNTVISWSDGYETKTYADGSPTEDTSYYFVNGQQIAKKDKNGTITYVHNDHLGSASVITDATGAVVEETKYDPWGKIAAGGTASKFAYTGQEHDGETGLHYYGARYYDADLKRFIQPDPVIQNIYDPQSLNRYSYVRNNPLRYTDPTGYNWFTDRWNDVKSFVSNATKKVEQKVNEGVNYVKTKVNEVKNYVSNVFNPQTERNSNNTNNNQNTSNQSTNIQDSSDSESSSKVLGETFSNIQQLSKGGCINANAGLVVFGTYSVCAIRTPQNGWIGAASVGWGGSTGLATGIGPSFYGSNAKNRNDIEGQDVFVGGSAWIGGGDYSWDKENSNIQSFNGGLSFGPDFSYPFLPVEFHTGKTRTWTLDF